MTKFTIIVDYGKPYDIKVGSERELKTELLKLKRQFEAGGEDEYPYFDVFVDDEHGKDVTDKMFKKLGVN